MAPQPAPRTTPLQTDPTQTIPLKLATTTFLLLSSLKYLLIPTYRSTDFDVHRNWLAITHHLPLSEWYFDDVNGTTVHTLDYPPLFAFFEWVLSNNVITKTLLEKGWLDERCLELLPDYDNEPSDHCVRFQRVTVIVSDAILFLGAYLASISLGNVYSSSINNGCGKKSYPWVTFLLIVTNPGLILLDHVHFQYNGMLLGVLLCSISFMIRGSQKVVKNGNNRQHQTDGGTSGMEVAQCKSSQWWELGAAATFAILMAMKHLYLTLAPLYLFYLFRHHCFVSKQTILQQTGNGNEKQKEQGRKQSTNVQYKFLVGRFIMLGIITLAFFLGPFVPFLMQNDPMGQMNQIMSRLFPFGRGLVHDYWAANIWALYLFTSKIASFAFRRAPLPAGIRHAIQSLSIFPFPEPPPSIVAGCLLLGLVPCMVWAWKVGGSSMGKALTSSPKYSNSSAVDATEFFIHAVVFSSFSGFMLGYHVHEKAIMTAILPLSLLATTSRENARLFIRSCLFGIFGILPLLFRTDELLLKLMLYTSWMAGAIFCLERIVCKEKKGGHKKEGMLTTIDLLAMVFLACLVMFMEIIHPIKFLPSGRLEFLPLMMTSVFCALGLLHCWVKSFFQMISISAS